MFSSQPSFPESISPISAEFSLPFSHVDTTVPPDEFPDLVHPDVDTSSPVSNTPLEPSDLPTSLPILPAMVLVFLFPADDIGMRKNKQKVIFTALDHLLLLPQGRAMSD
nr:hypothetical protein CFP56_48222 [Quercus suber]